MYNYRKVQEDLYWIGANDRRLAMFEGVYSVPDGVSYNAYVLLDEKTVLFDTVDKAVSKVFFENLAAVLAAGGSGFESVVKTTCFLADMEDFAAFNAVYEKYFTGKPARSCVAVKTLPKNVLVEVEVIAAV